MRYYDILITDPATNQLVRRYRSQDAFGNALMGALNVECDIPEASYDTPAGMAYVKVWGVPLADIAQQTALHGKFCQFYGGMQKGLPLANPKQAGLITQGIIQQPYGNWIGTEMSLDLILAPSTGSPSGPLNIVVNWKAGQLLATALANTLTTAFPGVEQSISISPNLVLSHDAPGFFQSLTQLARFVRTVSQQIAPSQNYPGVSIVVRDNTLFVYDTPTVAKPKQIEFLDLIGQPTWGDLGTIQFTCVMRADLALGMAIQLPKGPTIQTAQSYGQFRSTAFQGVFTISALRHVGNFRQQDATAWATIVNAVIAQ